VTQASTTEINDVSRTEEAANSSMFGDSSRQSKDKWFHAICAKLEHIDALEVGWDGYGAEKIPKTTIHFAAMLLGSVWAESLPLGVPAITPMSNGAISIEWRSASKEVTAEVIGANSVEVLVEDLVAGSTDEFHITSNFTRISEALERSVVPFRVVA
jgi:hypothetical protein